MGLWLAGHLNITNPGFKATRATGTGTLEIQLAVNPHSAVGYLTHVVADMRRKGEESEGLTRR